jgi:hypothetical protein
MSAAQQIESLKRDADRTSDPAKLLWIAERLNKWGAWDAAKEVETKARKIERQQAEAVNA